MDDARTFKTSQFKVKAILNNLIPITLSEKEIITWSIEPPSPIQHLRRGAPFFNLPGAPKPRPRFAPRGYAILDTPLIRVLFVSPWPSLISPLAIRVAPPPRNCTVNFNAFHRADLESFFFS